MSNVPKLRFKEFSGEWEENNLKKLSELITKGTTPKKFSNSGITFVKIEGINNLSINKDKCLFIDENTHNKELKRSILKEQDILFAIAGSLGKVAVVTKNILPANTNQALSIIRLKNKDYLNYILFVLQSRRMKKYIYKNLSVGAQPNLSLEQIGNFNFFLPLKQEQEKIASFLISVDTRIKQLTKKEELLQQYKKGVLQKIFNQEIRFKADDGSEFCEWEEKKLGEIFKRITTKNKEDNQNVLTISAQHGLINQEKFFNKSVSAKDVTGYYLLKKGDFAYNKSYSKGYPMGAIKKLNNYDKGVVSTLYICFRINSGYDSSFYEKYFDSGFLNKELHKIAQEGARNHGLLNMSVVEFFNDIKMPVPSIEEQNKIANFLSSIDSKIEQTQKQLESSKEFKKALLQQMFV